MKKWLCCALFLACSRELTVPPEAAPPRIDAITPASGFAGDVVVISGANLSDATAQVSFDIRAATILTPPSQRDGTFLAVQVPQDVFGRSVTVATPRGHFQKDDAFSYLGIGHPRNGTLRAVVPLGPSITGAAPSGEGNLFFLLDTRYGTFLTDAAATGAASHAVSAGFGHLVFGTEASGAWLLDLSPPASLRSFSPGVVPPSENTSRRVTVSAVPDPSLYAAADGSPGGTRFAVPGAAPLIQVLTLSNPPAQVAVNLGISETVGGLRFADENTLIGVTTNRPFRIDLGASSPVVSVGAVDASLAGATVLAMDDPSRRRMAFVRQDGKVGLVLWDAAGAPRVDAAVFATILTPTSLAFSPDGTRLLAGDASRALVMSIDLATGNLLGAQPLDAVYSLAPVRKGPAAGLVLAATGSGCELLFSDGHLARHDVVIPELRSIAVSPDGILFAATSFGSLVVNTISLAVLPTLGAPELDGVEGGPGGVVGWKGADLYAWKSTSWSKVASTGFAVNEAALSPNGLWVAASNPLFLDLQPRADNGAGLSAKHADFGIGAASPAPLRYFGDQLVAGHDNRDGTFAVSLYQPGTLTEVATVQVPGPLVALQYSPFAGSFFIDTAEAGGTQLTVWSPGKGTSSTSHVSSSYTQPAGLSADGRELVGISADPEGRNPGLDTLILDLGLSGVHLIVGPHVDLASRPSQVVPSPDGSRLYVALPAQGAIAVVE